MKAFIAILLGLLLLLAPVESTTYSCDHTAPCGCSQNDVVIDKIVGGEAAPSSTWDWAVSLRDFEDDHFCGGSVVSASYVITAAHCVDNELTILLGMTVAVGMNRLDESSTVGQVRKVARVIRHPQYTASTHANDIALLVLESPLDISAYRSTARLCLPRLSQEHQVTMYPPNESTLVAVGWGTLYSGATSSPNSLQQVTIHEVPTDHQICSPSLHYPDLQFCAGIYGGGKDTCQGDSGGPLMRYESGLRQWVLAGVTSYGRGCADPRHAGVYTRVTSYMDWINENIGMDGQVEVEVSTSTSPTITIPTTAVITSSESQTASTPANSALRKMISNYFLLVFVLFTFNYYFM